MMFFSDVGYLNDTSTTLINALPLDLTPSMGPGLGVHFDERRQVPPEARQLQVLDLQDVVADVVQ